MGQKFRDGGDGVQNPQEAWLFLMLRNRSAESAESASDSPRSPSKMQTSVDAKGVAGACGEGNAIMV